MTNNPQKPYLSMRGITKTFSGGIAANDAISLDVCAGQIHALLGENGAGKTTLMNVLSGFYKPDRGGIELLGEPVEFKSPRDAIAAGIGMVHQHFMLVPRHTVAENIALGLQGLSFFSPLKSIGKKIREFSARYELFVEPEARVWQLSAGERQKVEIIKVLLRGAQVLILDEPTSVLTPDEISNLFTILRRMRDEGKAIVFITHKLGEVFELADHITILRRGKVTARMSASDIRKDECDAKSELALKMVGREVILSVDREEKPFGETVLDARDLTVLDERGRTAVKNVSFSIRRGEIFGVVGVAGNGQAPLVRAVTGLACICSGSADINGTVCYIPEDRMHMGSVGDLTVAENSVLTRYRESGFSGTFLLDLPAIHRWSESLVSGFSVLTPSVDTPARQLSGGNLQRLILARELSRDGSLIVAEQPTHGLDVGSIEFVWKFLLEQRDRSGILLVTGDLGEALELCDRVGVMYRGTMHIFERPFDPWMEKIGLCMTGIAEECE